MSVQQKFTDSVKKANDKAPKVEYIDWESVPDKDKPEFKFWNQDDILKNSESVMIEGCEPRRRKDGSVFYEIILVDKTRVYSENSCDSNVARIIRIPAMTYTMMWDAENKKFSETKVAYCTANRVKVLGSGVLTYGMKLKQQIAEKIITAASVDI